MAARRRPAVPSVADLDYTSARKRTGGGKAFDSLVLGNKDAHTHQVPDRTNLSKSDPAARAKMLREIDYDTAMQLQAAKEGDDESLLPYQPTPSINPPRPRTLAAGYDPKTQTLRVRFRDGTPWAYFDVPPRVWRNFQKVQSPGRFINRTLNQYDYARDDF